MTFLKTSTPSVWVFSRWGTHHPGDPTPHGAENRWPQKASGVLLHSVTWIWNRYRKMAFLGPVLYLLELPGVGFKCTVTAGNQRGQTRCPDPARLLSTPQRCVGGKKMRFCGWKWYMLFGEKVQKSCNVWYYFFYWAISEAHTQKMRVKDGAACPPMNGQGQSLPWLRKREQLVPLPPRHLVYRTGFLWRPSSFPPSAILALPFWM